MTPKEKLDKALGISSDKSIDDFLSDLDLQDEESKNALVQTENAIKDSLENVQSSIQELSEPGNLENTSLAGDIQRSFSEINSLVSLSRKIIDHLYKDIISSELVDSELIASTASFIQATHENIREYVDLYRDQLKFFNSVKMEMIKHQHRKEEMELKQKLDLEKIRMSKPTEAVPENMVAFNQEGVINALKGVEL